MKNPYTVEPAVITEVRQETDETKTYTLEFRDKSRRLNFKPGQFNMISVPGIGEGAFSITSSPLRADSFDHTIRHTGNLTRAIAHLRAGDVVGVRGPFGSGWPIENAKGKDIMIIAGGVGVAPFRSLINLIVENRADFGSVEIFYGTREPKDLIYADEHEQWKNAPEMKLFLTVDEVPEGVTWEHGQGVVTNLLGHSIIDPLKSLALICGPEIMMRFITRSLAIRGFTEDNVFVSLERRMECGMAKCGRCMLGPKYVCMDGPVFSFAEARALPQNLIAANY